MQGNIGTFLFLLFQVLLPLSYSEPVGKCPTNNDWGTYLIDSKDCTVFYQCNWGQPIILNCPAGLHFNIQINVCDWPANANCGSNGGEITDSPEITTEPETPEETTDANEISTTEREEETEEPAETTDGPEVTTTESEEQTEDSEEDPGDIPNVSGPVGECPAVDGIYATLLPHASNCNLFYKCEFGNPVLFSCPEGLEFNPILSVCDWPEDAGCSAGQVPEDSGETTDGPEESTTEQEGETETPAETTDGNEITTEPEEETEEPLETTDEPEVPTTESEEQTGDSEETTENPATSEDPGDIPSDGGPVGECPVVDDTYATLLPDASNCNIFYKCEFGNPVLFNCPDGLEFNPTLSVCDWPEDAGCSVGQVPGDSAETTDGPEVSTTEEEGETETLEETTDGNEIPTEPEMETEEPLETITGPEVTTTESEEQTEDSEGTTINPGTSEGPDDIPSDGGPVGECPVVDGEYATLLPDASNCNIFYKCEFGNPVLFNCPDGLEFNPTLSVCDWPENAGCSAGQVPGDSAETTDSPEVSTTEEEEETETPKDTTDGTEIPTEPEVETEEPLETTNGPEVTTTESEEQTADSEETTENPATSEDPGDIPNDGGPVGECPVVDDTYATLLPDASNCNIFYKCEFGNPVLFNCPDGLEFNPTLSVCDWPENAGCSAGQVPGDSAETTDGPEVSTTEAEGETETLEETTDGNEIPTEPEMETEEPLETTTDPEVTTTESEEQTEDSEGTTINPGTSEGPDEIPGDGGPVGECPVVDGEYATLLPDASNCNIFYKCEFGNPVLFNCPDGLEFNPTLSVCDWPENAGCSAGQVPGDSAETTDGPEESTTEEEEETTNGNEIPTEPEMETEEPLETTNGPEVTTTESEEQTEDFEETTINPGTTADPDDIPSAGGPVGECPVVDGTYATLLPDASNCNLFYICVFGNPVLLICPEGLEFNPTFNVCDWPENAGCSTGQVPEDSGETTDGSEESTTEQEGETETPGETTDGNEITTEPEEETEEPLETTDEPEVPTTESEEQTGDSEETTENPATSEDPGDIPSDGGPVGECPVVDDTYATLLPDASNCNIFYKCEFGNPVLFTCPDGLEFNPTLSVCDWPENAGCSAGQIPEGSAETTDGPEVSTTEEEGETEAPEETTDGNETPSQSEEETEEPLETTDGPEVSTTESEEQTGDSEETTENPATSEDPGDIPSDGGPVGECPVVDDTYATLLPDVSNCNIFYKCEFGNPVLFNCPDGLEFNPTLSVCDWPENAGCSAGQVPGDSAETTDGPEVSTTEEEGETVTPEETTDGNEIPTEPEVETEEPTETTDGPEVPTTESEEQTEDSEESTINPGTSEGPDEIPGDGGPVGECPVVEGEYATLLPDASNCNIFYKCQYGVPILFSCPEGLEFNPTLSVCDWPENAGCSFRQEPEGSGETTDDLEVSTEDLGKGTEVPEETTYILNILTPERGAGDLPNVGCETLDCKSQNGYDVKFVPNDTDCTRFCKCDFGVVFEFQCPPGLHFNRVLDVCDWPSAAGCFV